MKKETLFVSFSGGRTSAYMSWWLKNHRAEKYNLIFLFANTGLEHENTLKFVDQCDKAWGLNVVWLEAVIDPRYKKGTRHKVVTYETASRSGEPFAAGVAKFGLPNREFKWCTRDLKIYVLNSYKRSLGFASEHLKAIGIRTDEIDRMSSADNVLYPLITMNPSDKPKILNWFKDQPFDLDLPEHLGNCVTCHKKSDRKLYTIAKHNPEYFDFIAAMEEKHAFAGAQDINEETGEIRPRRVFRGYRTSKDIIASSKQPFIEHYDVPPQEQLGLDIDPLDKEDDCGASSCEAIE